MSKPDDPEVPEEPARSASDTPSIPPEPPVSSRPGSPEMLKKQMREAQQEMREEHQQMREDQRQMLEKRQQMLDNQHQMREEQRKMREVQQQMREMPNPLGLRERRAQRQKLVADVIARHTIRSQNELQELLQEQGVLATQSSVSRDLRDLGVRRVKGVYVIKPSQEGGWSFDDVIELVELVTRSGFNLTVIQTVPNAARLVAHTLEETGWDEVVGTVADDDTIFVATRTQEDQDRLFQRFKQYLNA